MTKKEKKPKIDYPVYQARLSKDIIEWLRIERTKYGTANKMFNEIKKIYESKI